METVLTADQILELAENLEENGTYDDETFEASVEFAETMQEEHGAALLGNPHNL